MKTTPVKRCRPKTARRSTWIATPTYMAPLPARPCVSATTGTAKQLTAGAHKLPALIAVALLSANLSVLALTIAAPQQDNVESKTSSCAANTNTVSHAGEATSQPSDSAHLSSVPAITLSAPAAPMNSPAPLVSVEEDIRDIRSPRHVRNPWLWAALAVGALALMVGTFGLWLWVRRASLFEELPYEIALDRLEEARRYLSPDHAREFCIAVSEVIRGYIEVRFGIRAAHRTTSEFLHDLLDATDPRLTAHRAALGDFLRHCDMAKFALWRFSTSEMEDLHLSARTFVLQSAIDALAEAAANPPTPLPKSPRVHLDPPTPVEVQPMARLA